MSDGVYEFDFGVGSGIGLSEALVYMAMRLKDEGYTSEDVYQFFEKMFSMDLRLEEEKKQRYDGTLDLIFKVAGSKDIERVKAFLDYLDDRREDKDE